MKCVMTFAMGLALALPAAQALSAEVELANGTKLSDTPTYIVTYIEAAPGDVEAVAGLLRKQVEESRKDDGNLRFEALQGLGRKNHFSLLEAWRDPAAREAHAKAEHTVGFRKELQPHLYSPYDERPHVGLVAAAPDGLPQGDDSTVYIVTHVDIIPTEQFAPCKRQVSENGPCGNELVTGLAEKSRKHDGNLRFDVLTQANRPNHMTLLEAWSSQAAQDAHTVNADTRNFRDSISGLAPGAGVSDDPLSVINPLSGSLYDEQLYAAVK